MTFTDGVDHGALIPKPNVAREFGVCSRTLSRWLNDGALGFPRPVTLRGRNYFARSELVDKINRMSPS